LFGLYQIFFESNHEIEGCISGKTLNKLNWLIASDPNSFLLPVNSATALDIDSEEEI
jgi:hypothetical protein